jgi:hypothetical protein
MKDARPDSRVRHGLLVLAALLVAGCGQEQGADEAPADSAAAPAAAPARPEEAELNALREKFSPLQDFAQAAGAGYSEAITSCWYHRVEGGQGVHYARTELIDSVITVMDPEIVMYEPQQGGGMQLVGIEYIVPFAQWTSQSPPMVLGQQMHRNEALSLWVHHVWLFRDNPSGLYADWNPTVSCTNATESEDRAPPAP